jgi:rod shape-determining protein MreC
MLWTHPDFRVSAMSPDGSAFGIAQAHLTGATGGYLLELRGVPFRATLKPGSVIISSGWGGVWPRGIPVGTVLSEIKTTENWARTYLLRPAVNPADIYQVMILTRDRVGKGVDGVWESAAQVQAAAQRIVVSGDSAAKSAALAEAAARKAVLDSMARANAPATGATDSTRPVTTAPPPVRRPAPVDTTRRDTIRRDTATRDTTRRDTIPPPPPSSPRQPGVTR